MEQSSKSQIDVNEISMLKQLSHKNIIKLHNAKMIRYKKSEFMLIVMEYAQGGSLLKLIEDKKK